MADRIGIAPVRVTVTVEMHVRSARRRLNNLTIAEAVAKALLYQRLTHD